MTLCPPPWRGTGPVDINAIDLQLLLADLLDEMAWAEELFNM
ncbi:MAG: hypothetical protein RI601_05015 [Desulfurivibrionaceae bacterium]|nr:hypothetical protein [Desulfurivibrionaceae bacterium]